MMTECRESVPPGGAVRPVLASPAPDLTGLPLTLGGFLLRVCAEHADREALVFDDPLRGGSTVRWSYSELERTSRSVAAGLLARGVGRGTRVGVLMSNRPEAVAAYFGIALAGGVLVPLSTFSTRPELEQLLRLSGVRTVLTQSRMGHRDLAGDLTAIDAPLLREVIVVGGAAAPGLTAWTELTEAVGAVDEDVSASDEGLVIFSSGTTAEPKGMLHAHRSPTLQFWLQSRLFARTSATRMWTALPLFWTAGMNTAMGATLAAGGTFVMQEGFDAGEALRLLARERVTEPYTLPHQARALAEHPDWKATDLSSLRCVFGKSVFARHPSVTGDPGWQMPVGWGMSETCAFISAHASDQPREVMRRSLGTLMPGMELTVVDPDTAEQVAPGEDGELWVRGALLMLRYLGKDREQCFTADGWLRTGDVGHVDADGEVHWVGRRTEMIKTGGANVSPAEIEVALRAHPDVRLARVLGLPDERLEQIAVLCVEPAVGASPDAASLQGYLRERLAAYKVPKRVELFAAGEIPMTASGTKVRDDALRELLLARSESRGAPA